jgi:hypothetical protein
MLDTRRQVLKSALIVFGMRSKLVFAQGDRPRPHPFPNAPTPNYLRA